MYNIRKTIRNKAFLFLDQEELKNNSGFKSPKFEMLMKSTGWQKGQAWCAFFVELVWQQADLDTELFSGSVVKTWENFHKMLGRTQTLNAEVGDIVIWQTYRNGKPRWTGHTGVVVGIDRGKLITVEGNTNNDGSREGIEVALKVRPLNYNTNNGLRLIGFIKP